MDTARLGLQDEGMSTSARTYGGRTSDERKDERRRRLIDAALAIWGDEGWAAVTMRRVCADAGLIDRYFYESFADRDELLVATWDEVRSETIARILEVLGGLRGERPLVQLRAAIAAFVNAIDTDPPRARILFGEHSGSAGLEARRRDAIRGFTKVFVEWARPHLKPGADATAFRMSTLLGIGGFVALVRAWRDGIFRADAARVIEHATSDGEALAARYLS